MNGCNYKPQKRLSSNETPSSNKKDVDSNQNAVNKDRNGLLTEDTTNKRPPPPHPTGLPF
jgi:hypothetical protein